MNTANAILPPSHISISRPRALMGAVSFDRTNVAPTTNALLFDEAMQLSGKARDNKGTLKKGPGFVPQPGKAFLNVKLV